MKMFLVCPHFRNIEYGVTDSFKRLGADVYPFYFNMGMDRHHYYQRIKHKFGGNIDAFLQDEKKKINTRLLEEYQRIQPDLVYVIQGRWVAAETIREFKKHSYVALYLWDMVSLFPEMIETFKEYDTIYSFDKSDTKNLIAEGYNAKFKPSGYDDSVYYPMDCNKEYDVAFVGAMYRERVDLLKRLHIKFPNIKWAVYGEYAPLRKPVRWLRWRFSSNYHFFKNKNINKNEVNELYNKSKIVLSIVRSNQDNGWSARLPEILGTKSFQITTHFPIVESEFSNCLCTYKDESELIAQIAYYLSNEVEREQIAENGYNKAKELSDDQLNLQILKDYLDWRKNTK